MARLIWDGVIVSDDLVTIQLGKIQIALPDPVAQPWRELAANPGHELTAHTPRQVGYSAEHHPDVTSIHDTSQPA
ncbi:hypothetical protein [Paenarthrobacter aromaticivorans]|uniref:Uncharacterized protein n=1 Tax=Paenarthrobacter aromaticivorans TaxID=2849150 RepID=A0ABS6I9V8_9MICC|nr:hypothetical protein [Paenarthrobacter sp. MMS21-TAE1-1]MBU8868500.1 hypothetical protein [Paenarthrobacter sp. MMS21-TAE1-1]